VHFKIADPPGEAFPRLAEQIDRRRAEQQKSSGFSPAAATRIDEAAKGLEQTRKPVYFVEDDELVGMVREIKLGFGEFRPVRIGFKVEINGR